MWKQIALGFALTMGSTAVFAQGTPARDCLHGANETAANRARRQQAILYAARVNMAETGLFNRGRGASPYRPLEELPNLPLLPTGFDVQFHTDGATYTFSLKDSRDACHYAVFSDQDTLVYEALPSKSEPTIVPLGTK
jgi:hypothetical protein